MQARAYINHGRWVVECPVCGGGELALEKLEVCGIPTCGTQFEVVYPEAPERVAAERVLMAREDPDTRNWRPDRGEQVLDLKAENAVRGVAF